MMQAMNQAQGSLHKNIKKTVRNCHFPQSPTTSPIGSFTGGSISNQTQNKTQRRPFENLTRAEHCCKTSLMFDRLACSVAQTPCFIVLLLLSEIIGWMPMAINNDRITDAEFSLFLLNVFAQTN